MVIFDEGLYQSEQAPFFVYPTTEQSRLLPQCEVVSITGMGFYQQDHGKSSLFLPKGKGNHSCRLFDANVSTRISKSRVTVLEGSLSEGRQKEKLFRAISLGGGIAHVRL